jgi:predicted nucleic acid-binding protein
MVGLRVVCDTHTLLCGLAFPASAPGRILATWRQGGVELVLSPQTLDSLVRALARLRRNPLNASAIQDLADGFLFMANLVAPVADFDEPSLPPRGKHALGTLLAAQADYLVTADAGLLSLGDRHPIVTPAVFWQRHGH